MAQRLQDAPVVDRMEVAADDRSKCTDVSMLVRVNGQKRWVGVALLKPNRRCRAGRWPPSAITTNSGPKITIPCSVSPFSTSSRPTNTSAPMIGPTTVPISSTPANSAMQTRSGLRAACPTLRRSRQSSRAYPQSPRQIEKMMAERGVVVDHAVIHRWSISQEAVASFDGALPARAERSTAGTEASFVKARASALQSSLHA